MREWLTNAGTTVGLCIYKFDADRSSQLINQLLFSDQTMMRELWKITPALAQLMIVNSSGPVPLRRCSSFRKLYRRLTWHMSRYNSSLGLRWGGCVSHGVVDYWWPRYEDEAMFNDVELSEPETVSWSILDFSRGVFLPNFTAESRKRLSRMFNGSFPRFLQSSGALWRQIARKIIPERWNGWDTYCSGILW